MNRQGCGPCDPLWSLFPRRTLKVCCQRISGVPLYKGDLRGSILPVTHGKCCRFIAPHQSLPDVRASER